MQDAGETCINVLIYLLLNCRVLTLLLVLREQLFITGGSGNIGWLTQTRVDKNFEI